MKKWGVRFRKPLDDDWDIVNRPFERKESAQFFVDTIQMLSPFRVEAEIFEQEDEQ